MKRVSYKVAKALRDAGYPQGKTLYRYVTCDVDTYKEGEIVDGFYEAWAGNNVIDAPLALDVWLWLWRERDYAIECVYKHRRFQNHKTSYGYADPEEAIIAAIEHLDERDLIK